MSSYQARMSIVDADIAELKRMRDFRLQDLENRMERLREEMVSLFEDYRERIILLKVHKTSFGPEKLQKLKEKLLELNREADGGNYEEDAGVLKSFIKEMKKIVRSDTPIRTSHMKDILDNLDPTWYHGDIAILVNKTIELYEEWVG